MGKISELDMAIRDLRTAASTINDVANTLAEMFGGATEASEPAKPAAKEEAAKPAEKEAAKSADDQQDATKETSEGDEKADSQEK